MRKHIRDYCFESCNISNIGKNSQDHNNLNNNIEHRRSTVQFKLAYVKVSMVKKISIQQVRAPVKSS